VKREKRSEQRRKRGKPTKRSCARSMAELSEGYRTNFLCLGCSM